MYSKILLGSSIRDNPSNSLEAAKAEIKRFGDGEIWINVEENLEGQGVIIIQSLYSSDMIIELALIIDACMRKRVSRLALMIPYMGYARQDRQFQNSALSAKVLADILCLNPLVMEVATFDLHNYAISGFFNVPLFNFYPNKLFAECKHPKDLCVVSPDFGGVERSLKFAKEISENTQFAFLRKYRSSPGVSETTEIVGNVSGKNCIIIDDIVDGGGTLCNAAKLLLQNGAKSASAYITHGIFSGNAIENIYSSPLAKLVVTDSIPRNQKSSIRCAQGEHKITYISCTPLVEECISLLNNSGSSGSGEL